MEIIGFIKDFAITNGATSVIVLILTMILTNIIKIPIKKHAEKIATLASASGFNIKSSFVTSKIVYIPFGLAFAMFCIVEGIMRFAYQIPFDFVEIVSKTPMVAIASVGLYSILSNVIDKASQKDEYKAFTAKQELEKQELAKQEQINKEII